MSLTGLHLRSGLRQSYHRGVHSMRPIQALHPWPNQVVETNGNYEEETYLELSDKPLYKHQATLPRLPVPSLEDTVERFLPTAIPLVDNQEEEESLRRACRDFPEQAQHLQERLLQRAASLPNTSWLQLWWNQWGYLQVRDPIVINVSYFFNLPDDTTLCRGNDRIQVRRAATVIKAAWEYRNQVCSGQLPQETMGKSETPLCSVGFKYLFHSCRVPKLNQDSYKLYDPSVYSHTVVACRGHFYSLPLLDDFGKEYSLHAIEHALEDIITLAEQSKSLELGLLTSSNRDVCAHARSELLRVGGTLMEDALSNLESGMLMVCLDEEEPFSQQQSARLYWHGHGSSNRWYDKNIQLCVTRNGKLGYVGEHAMMDGMPAVGICRHFLNRTYRNISSTEYTEDMSTLKPIVRNIFEPVLSRLDGSSVGTVQRLVDDAREKFNDLIASYDMHVENFQGYGTEFIKSAGHSPDAYIQMAIQLAAFRLFGKQVATYESTQVRPFLHGRTETTRTVSPPSNAFLKAMGLRPRDDHGDTAAVSRKITLLKEATESHVKYIRLASQAQGVDRHLTGLTLSSKAGEDLPALLTHPLHGRSKLWRVSTSTLPGTSPGFGPVCDIGVGVGYEVKAQSCIFTISSLKHNNWTEPLCHYLEEALMEMKELINENRALKSRL